MSSPDQVLGIDRRRLAAEGSAEPDEQRADASGAARVARIRARDARYRRLLALADATAIACALSFSALVLGDDRLSPTALIIPFLLIVVAKAMRLYDRDEHLMHKTTFEEVPAIFALATVAVLLIYLSGDWFIDGEFGRRQIFGTWILLTGLMVVTRSLARLVARITTEPERCLLIGNTTREESLRSTLELSAAAHAEMVGVLPITSYPARNPESDGRTISVELIDDLNVDRVIIAPGSHGADELMFVIRELRDAGVKVSVLPDVSRLASSSFELDYVGGVALLGMRRFAISRSSLIIKRAFDLVVSIGALLVLSPLLIAIAIAIRADSGGPALFRQPRIGRNGRSFSMLKFRSMNCGAESRREELRHLDEGAEGLFKIPNDPRITRVGRWLRQTSTDELPQLVNVVRGDMSLVGPRPLVPDEDAQILGLYRRRLDVRPGMTGHWQILGSSRVPLEEMVKLDYLYASDWSLWGDLVLLARTMPVIARRSGI